MANLRVFDPYVVDSVDDVFRNFFRGARLETPVPAPQIKVDVEEVDNNYLVKAELAGVKKDDINVDVDGNYVSIQAEVKNEKEIKKDGKVLRSERYFGSVSRAFTLGSEIDAANVKAKFENGVLELTLPKRVSAQTKRVSIQ